MVAARRNHKGRYLGFKMNDSEAKTKETGDGLQPDSWQSGRREVQIVGYLEPGVDLSLRSFRNEAEIHAINYALEQTGWNRKQAAKLLSISYRSLLYKIRRHNITPSVEHS
jgi:DNA-binding NtrC family response regulator